MLIAICLACGPRPEACAQSVRKPAVAGMFYPDDPGRLSDMIDALTRQARQSQNKPLPESPLFALVMPHAGYAYCGATAAHAAVVLENRRFSKIIILAPDHRVGFKGGAITDADAYQTPLGAVPIHPDADKLRNKHDFFRSVPASDRQEHAVEVILPFLQAWLSDFQIIPVVLGRGEDVEAFAGAISTVMDNNTLIIASTDLSHYLPYEQARTRDRQTIDLIARLQSEDLFADPGRACGRIPLLVLMNLAEKRHWKARVLDYTNSGDTAGSRDRVVGYTTIVFYGDTAMTLDQEDQRFDKNKGEILLEIARKTIAGRLGLSYEPSTDLDAASRDPELESCRGTFVTLKINDRLRGCIGNLAPDKPLLEGIQDNAVNAAFKDPRFAPLSKEEFDKIRIEVSLLTAPKPLNYKDGQDLLDRLRPHVDGVILRKGPYSSTFLPQVWEQLPDKRAFLEQLCMKAGLPADAWQKGGLEVLTYQVQYFEEPG